LRETGCRCGGACKKAYDELIHEVKNIRRSSSGEPFSGQLYCRRGSSLPHPQNQRCRGSKHLRRNRDLRLSCSLWYRVKRQSSFSNNIAIDGQDNIGVVDDFLKLYSISPQGVFPSSYSVSPIFGAVPDTANCRKRLAQFQ
jgi:hypothetical protein